MTVSISLVLLGILAAIGLGVVIVLRRGPNPGGDDAPAAKKQEPYGFRSRLIFFAFVAAMLALILGVLLVRLGIGVAMTAGGSGGSGMAGIVMLAGPFLLIAAGYLIFKR